MINISLSDENNSENENDLIYNDTNFSILSFNLNIGGLALNKKYENDDTKHLQSPNFFKSIENKILIIHPNIIVLVTQGDVNEETYFHSHFLPNIMNKLQYKLLTRDKNSQNQKLGILRMSIYIKNQDDSIKNIQLNKKLITHNNTYTSDKCVSLVIYIQTLLGMIAFIGVCTFDKNIIEIENKFVKDKLIDYIFILGDFPNYNSSIEEDILLSNIQNYEQTNHEIDNFFQIGNVLFYYKINRIEKVFSKIIKDDDIGLKTKCNLGLLGLYEIVTQKIKCVNVLDTGNFPKFSLIDKFKNNGDFLYQIQISHKCVFFLSSNKIFVYIDDDLPFYKDKFFLQRRPSDFNGNWIIENKKNIKYNNFIRLDTYENEIKSFSSGYEHIIFLTNSGKIFGLGNNKYGQLGLSLSLKICYFFIEIDIEDVLLVKCGAFHTIINTQKGLYAFGNNLFGQLGIKNKYLCYVYSITKINIHLKIKDISCGDYHTLLLTDNGDVYGFGSNKYGQLGLDNYDEDIIYPTILNLQNVLSIYCGDNYSMINTKNGLFILYKNKICKNIHEIKLKNILSISCGKDFVLILNNDGLFGLNLSNLILININIKSVNSIHCGFNKSIIQTRRNNTRVYTFYDILDNSTSEYLWDVI